jgi:hypothetical protein
MRHAVNKISGRFSGRKATPHVDDHLRLREGGLFGVEEVAWMAKAIICQCLVTWSFDVRLNTMQADSAR